MSGAAWDSTIGRANILKITIATFLVNILPGEAGKVGGASNSALVGQFAVQVGLDATRENADAHRQKVRTYRRP